MEAQLSLEFLRVGGKCGHRRQPAPWVSAIATKPAKSPSSHAQNHGLASNDGLLSSVKAKRDEAAMLYIGEKVGLVHTRSERKFPRRGIAV